MNSSRQGQTRVFITGAAGVIGMQLVKLLEGLEDVLILAGDLKDRPEEFSSPVQYIKGDLNLFSPSDWRDFRPDVVFHLAASFERSVETLEFWEENNSNNVQLSSHIAALAAKSDFSTRLVFASSYLVYDPSLYFDRGSHKDTSVPVALSTGSNISPRNLVGSAKFFHEMELRFLESFPQNQLSNVIARIYRGYGPGSRDIISRWVRSLLREERISAYGVESMFDFIYSKDSAGALAGLGLRSEFCGTVDVGSGIAYSISDVLEILVGLFPGADITYQESDLPLEKSVADVQFLRQITEWSPKYDLTRAIAEIVEYERCRL